MSRSLTLTSLHAMIRVSCCRPWPQDRAICSTRRTLNFTGWHGYLIVAHKQAYFFVGTKYVPIFKTKIRQVLTRTLVLRANTPCWCYLCFILQSSLADQILQQRRPPPLLGHLCFPRVHPGSSAYARGTRMPVVVVDRLCCPLFSVLIRKRRTSFL